MNENADLKTKRVKKRGLGAPVCMASRRPVVTAAAVRTVKGRWRQAARAAAATAAAGSEAAGLAVAARRGAPLTPPGWERIIGGLRVWGLGSEPKPHVQVHI